MVVVMGWLVYETRRDEMKKRPALNGWRELSSRRLEMRNAGQKGGKGEGGRPLHRRGGRHLRGRDIKGIKVPGGGTTQAILSPGALIAGRGML